mgnify:CR=1 FL=1
MAGYAHRAGSVRQPPPAGVVLHTGDWKIDPTPIIGLPTDEKRLRELGDAGVLALVGDSTNAVREGRSPSETEVAATITKLVKAAKGRVAVTTFASNVARLKDLTGVCRDPELDTWQCVTNRSGDPTVVGIGI